MKHLMTRVLSAAVITATITASAVSAQTGVVIADMVNVRTNPSTSSQIVGTLYGGEQVNITYDAGDWYEIYKNGECYYVNASYISCGGGYSAKSYGSYDSYDSYSGYDSYDSYSGSGSYLNEYKYKYYKDYYYSNYANDNSSYNGYTDSSDDYSGYTDSSNDYSAYTDSSNDYSGYTDSSDGYGDNDYIESYDESGSTAYADTSNDGNSSSASSSSGTYLGNFTLTAYCNCEICCGTAGNPTASGVYPTAGHTVAMGGVPFGTQLLINGTVYTVEDRGTPYGHVDIFFNSHSEALAFGLQSADVYQLN